MAKKQRKVFSFHIFASITILLLIIVSIYLYIRTVASSKSNMVFLTPTPFPKNVVISTSTLTMPTVYPNAASLKMYTNVEYSFRFQYPSQWKCGVIVNKKNHFEILCGNGNINPSAEVDCDSTANNLDPKTYWKRYSPSGGIGLYTTALGEQAFVSFGQGDVSFHTYTFTHKNNACSLLISDFAQTLGDTLVNTFQWK